MQSVKRHHLLQLICLSILTFCGCGDTDDVEISCSNFEPCRTTRCGQCGWPSDSCSISTGDLVSAFVPTTAKAPFLIFIDLTILEDLQEGENICGEGKIIISNSDGELINQSLTLDMPTNLCITSSAPGNHTISLSCSDFPTRARYQASIIDSSGMGLWP